MSLFRELFLFSRSEVIQALSHAVLKKKQHGFKLLYLPTPSIESYGKLLIITPRACGKAHERNLIRRRIKAIFYQDQLYKTALVSIIIVSFRAQDCSFETMQQFLRDNISI